MTKAWIASIAGRWNDNLINAVHVVYYIATLTLLFFALRRSVSRTWALLGLYVLSSLPLYLLHGTTTYADVFMSMHVFVAFSLLYSAAAADNRAHANAFYRLSAMAGALLSFTKNEGFALYLPLFIALFSLSILWQCRKNMTLEKRDVLNHALLLGTLLAVIAAPWITYKLYHGMVFGNAHPVGAFALQIRPMALISISITTLFEGNWLLLFPLLVLLLLLSLRTVVKTPLLVLAAFLFIAYAAQLFLFLFFSTMATELIKQTGYARGVIHLIPTMAFLVTLLLHQLFVNQDNS
jgi:hypothetical protein